MPVRVRLHAKHFDRPRRTLAGYENRAYRFLGGISDQVFEYLEEGVERFFAAGAGPDGPWPPNSPRTIARKGHGRVLIDTSRMEYSLTYGDHGVGSLDAVRDTSPLTLRYGTRVPYAFKHMLGQGVPYRRFIPYGDQIDGFIVRRSAEFIMGWEPFTIKRDMEAERREAFEAISRLAD